MLSELCHSNTNRQSYVDEKKKKKKKSLFFLFRLSFSQQNSWLALNKVELFRVIEKAKTMPKKSAVFSQDIGVLFMHFNVIRISRKTFSQSAIGLFVFGPKNCETIVLCGQSNSLMKIDHLHSKICF